MLLIKHLLSEHSYICDTKNDHKRHRMDSNHQLRFCKPMPFQRLRHPRQKSKKEVLYFMHIHKIQNLWSFQSVYKLQSHFFSFINFVKNPMSCLSSSFIHCHKLIHFRVTGSGAFAPDFYSIPPTISWSATNRTMCSSIKRFCC